MDTKPLAWVKIGFGPLETPSYLGSENADLWKPGWQGLDSSHHATNGGHVFENVVLGPPGLIG